MTSKFVNRFVLISLYILANIFLGSVNSAPAKKLNANAVAKGNAKNAAGAVAQPVNAHIKQDNKENIALSPKVELTPINYRKIDGISKDNIVVLHSFLDYFIQNAISSQISPLGIASNLQKDRLFLKVEVNILEPVQAIGFFSPKLGIQFYKKDGEIEVKAENAGLFNKANALEINLSPTGMVHIYSQKDMDKIISKSAISRNIARQISLLFREERIIQDKNYTVIDSIAYLEDIMNLQRTYGNHTVFATPQGQPIITAKDALKDKQQALYMISFALALLIQDRLVRISDLVYDKLILDNGGSIEQIKQINEDFKELFYSKESAKKELFFNLYEKKNREKLNAMVNNAVTHSKGLVIKCSSEAEANNISMQLKNLFDITKIREKIPRQSQQENMLLQQRVEGIMTNASLQSASEMIAEKYDRVGETNINSDFMTEEEITNYNNMCDKNVDPDMLSHVFVAKKNLENNTNGYYVYVFLRANENFGTRTGLELSYLLYSNKFSKFKLNDNDLRKAKKQVVLLMVKKITDSLSTLGFASKEVEFKYSLVNSITNNSEPFDMGSFVILFIKDKNIANLVASLTKRQTTAQSSEQESPNNNEENPNNNDEQYFGNED
jgi:hypothetical protein